MKVEDLEYVEAIQRRSVLMRHVAGILIVVRVEVDGFISEGTDRNSELRISRYF